MTLQLKESSMREENFDLIGELVRSALKQVTGRDFRCETSLNTKMRESHIQFQISEKD